jgi:tRNA threonylcarbamoyladenosine biosynthesis protein TsaB
MNLLAIDCSTEYLSLALEARGAVHVFHEHAGQRHAEAVLGEISTLCQSADLEMKALNGIAYGRGPGSFTGLRIACGVTQGLAYALNVPVYGVVTLEALAEEAFLAHGAERVIACTDARMGEVYHAAYRRRAHGWTEICAPGVYKPGLVPDVEGSVEGAGWSGCGSGFGVHREALLARYPALQSVRPELMPTARAELALARAVFHAGRGLPAHEAVPLYIRDNVALKKSERQ